MSKELSERPCTLPTGSCYYYAGMKGVEGGAKTVDCTTPDSRGRPRTLEDAQGCAAARAAATKKAERVIKGRETPSKPSG